MEKKQVFMYHDNIMPEFCETQALYQTKRMGKNHFTMKCAKENSAKKNG